MFSSSFREEILCNAFRGQPDVIDAKDVDAVKRAVDIRPLLEALVGMQSRDIPYTPNEWKTCISITRYSLELFRGAGTTLYVPVGPGGHFAPGGSRGRLTKCQIEQRITKDPKI